MLGVTPLPYEVPEVMKKIALSILELAGLIGSILGLIGLLSSAGSVQYRQRPPAGFISTDADFATMVNDEESRPLFNLLLKADIDHLMRQDGNVIRELTQIIHDYPSFLKAHYFRGILYLSMGYIDTGIADLQSVLAGSSDTALRQQAGREILLARIAQAATPITFLGCIAFAVFFISIRLGVKFAEWGRAAKMSTLAGCVIWFSAFMFLLFH